RMAGVVCDARHDLGAAEALRIFKGGVGNQLSIFEVQQAHDHGRCSKIHRDSVNGTSGSLDFDSVNQDAVSVTRHSRIERESLTASGQAVCLPFNAHVSAAHGVAANFTAGAG